jgi:hypothetical protein
MEKITNYQAPDVQYVNVNTEHVFATSPQAGDSFVFEL